MILQGNRSVRLHKFAKTSHSGSRSRPSRTGYILGRTCATGIHSNLTRLTMNAKFLLLLSLAAIVAADSREIYRPSQVRIIQLTFGRDITNASSEESYESSEAKYSFNWAVSDDSSSNEFGHQEARDGDHTQGSYYVQLPDGRLQTVTYFVDGDSGYVAEVNYEGEISDESNSSESEEDTAEYDS
ncbi:uncharacterized protein LOC119596649 [Penaeus monodon]|uniref:uncharacterized protein LOC119596649 n=1 Tax=Penaeus monodon TaxID=6687 RepID=UPI0018A7BEC4|nr:uncharacterized protein LOC119596649 [Penaeus monodon]